MKSDIILTIDKDEYVAGDAITGSVKIVLTQEVKVKDLLLKITGQAKVCWDEQRTYSKGSATSVSRRNTETYLDHVIVLLKKDKIPNTLLNNKRKGSCIRPSPAPSIQDMTSPPLSSCWGGTDAEEGLLIPPGEHNFHFEFTLPKNLPSTYSGRWGNVRYSVKSVLERPWKFDIEREQEFTVAANVDLNEDPDLLRPVGALGEFRSGILCFSGGLINLEIRLSRRGYIAGEDIPFQVVIDNNTGRKLHNAKVSLVQHVIFRAGQKSKRICRTAATLNKGEISPWKVDNWENDKLTIPSDTPPSTDKHISSIQIKYTFTLNINYSTWRDEFVFPVNIFIGKQPFKKGMVQSYLNILGYSVTPKTSPCSTPRLGNRQRDDGDNRSRSPSKPTIPSSLVILDQLRMRRASICAGTLPMSEFSRHTRLDSTDSSRSNPTNGSPLLSSSDNNNTRQLSRSQPIPQHSPVSSLTRSRIKTKNASSELRSLVQTNGHNRDLNDVTSDDNKQHRKKRTRAAGVFESKQNSLEQDRNVDDLPLNSKVRVESFALQTKEKDISLLDAITE